MNQCTVESPRLSGSEPGGFAATDRERGRGTVLIAAAVAAAALAGCAPGSDAKGPPFAADLLPPTLLSAEARDGRTLVFLFDEAATPTSDDIAVDPALPVESVVSEERMTTLRFAEDQIVGESYVVRMDVEDGTGNSLSFLYEFTGWNPRIPDLLINEINPRGSDSTPDCIELRAMSGGNLGGLWLTVGTADRYSGDILLPAVEVAEGDYLLIHAKGRGLPEEIDETGDMDASGGRLASDTARDFWMPGAPGLPGNNGAVVLHARRGGPVIDAVLWTDRTFDPDDEDLGWTRDGLVFATALGNAGAWKAAEGGTPTPSDAVDASKSTATRSICRASIPVDEDAASDWHVVPTSGQTFGSVNSDEVHVP